MARPLALEDLFPKDPVAALRFALEAAGLPPPVLEHRFHPTRRWRFDAAWPERMVALEVDGGIFSGGRHVRGAGYREDCRKLNAALLLGWRVLRVTPDMILKNGAGEALGYLRGLLA